MKEFYLFCFRDLLVGLCIDSVAPSGCVRMYDTRIMRCKAFCERMPVSRELTGLEYPLLFCT